MAPVTVTLHGILNLHQPGRQRTIQLELQSPSTVRQLLEGLGVPIETLWILSLNGDNVQPEAPITGGDRLEVFPILCGG